MTSTCGWQVKGSQLGALGPTLPSATMSLPVLIDRCFDFISPWQSPLRSIVGATFMALTAVIKKIVFYKWGYNFQLVKGHNVLKLVPECWLLLTLLSDLRLAGSLTTQMVIDFHLSWRLLSKILSKANRVRSWMVIGSGAGGY